MKFADFILPIPKKVKFRKALWWWLVATYKPYGRQHRRKFCSECAWPLVYLDELYDVPIEAHSPDVVAECSFCGTEFVEYISCWSNKIWAVLPKR